MGLAATDALMTATFASSTKQDRNGQHEMKDKLVLCRLWGQGMGGARAFLGPGRTCYPKAREESRSKRCLLTSKSEKVKQSSSTVFKVSCLEVVVLVEMREEL